MRFQQWAVPVPQGVRARCGGPGTVRIARKVAIPAQNAQSGT